jgi:replicative superfamily II helicase
MKARSYTNYGNLVIIKGTQVYDNSKGSFVDLSVLDVLQVFGRAGRPGFETSGQGFICTSGEKLQHYLDAVTSQVGESGVYFTCSCLTICAESY